MRSLSPAETMVYLETNDLGQTLQALTQSKSFQQFAKTTMDLSALQKAQVALVVTGFETSEKQLTDESSILNFKPRFTLIAETHAWESTAVSIVEDQLGRFAKDNYGSDVKLEKSDKAGAKFYVWTAADGRKIFAGVVGSLIYLSNDETMIDKCLAVRRGEADNLLKDENLARAREQAGDGNLSFGYIAPDGIFQLANLAGVSAAIDASEEDSVRSFIAKILPAILQKTVKEVAWTSRKTEQGIEDKIFIKTEEGVSSVWKETLIAKSEKNFESAEFLPNEINSLTRYNLQNPQIAWRSVLLSASKPLDTLSAKILTRVSGSLFEPYGVADIESFLSSVGSQIVTARFDDEGDKSVVIAEIKNEEKLKKSLSAEINFKLPPQKQGAANIWHSADKTLSAAIIENRLILGESEGVMDCLLAKKTGQNFTKSEYFEQFTESNAVTVTLAADSETARKMVNILGTPKEEAETWQVFSLTETRFIGNGLERRTISDFGVPGTIIEQFEKPKRED